MRNNDPSPTAPDAVVAPDHSLDTRGTLCPIPILLTARRVAQIAVGERLEVLGDDPGILEDMPVWCTDNGHPLLAIDRHDSVIRCLLEKAPDRA